MNTVKSMERILPVSSLTLRAHELNAPNIQFLDAAYLLVQREGMVFHRRLAL